jgi:hypothetical protein
MVYEDWLNDPLVKDGPYDYLKTNSPKSDSYQSWKSFHFDTRLKLNGADFFLRQIFGATSRSDSLGLSNLAYQFQQWYLDAFFNELLASYEILLQELNTIFECSIDSHDNRFYEKLTKELPQELSCLLKKEQAEEWFINLKSYRNTISHRSRNIIDGTTTYSEKEPWHAKTERRLHRIDKQSREWKSENIAICETYLNKMIEHIHIVWENIKKHHFCDSPK